MTVSETVDLKTHRSVSQLTTWLNCGEAYRLQRKTEAPRKPAAWLLQGIAFHAAIEFWELADRAPSLEACVSEYDLVWTEEAEALPEIPLDSWLTGSPRVKGTVDYERRVARGRQQVADYMEWANAHAHEWRIYRDSRFPGEGMGIEVPIELELGEHKAVTLKGYIDQIIEYRNGEIRPRDLKTGSKKPDSPVQLGVYAMALREQYGLPDVWQGDFYMAKDKGVTEPYNLSVYTFDTVSLWFENLNEAIEQEIFIPNPGSMCNVCDVWQWCSAVGPNRGTF